jgi:hypothetical protein
MSVPAIETRAEGAPLESFVRDYLEITGGVWDEVEPAVYDLVFAAGEEGGLTGTDRRDVLRITFDPEALPEHPGAQLASFGTPLVDRLLACAIERGRSARVYFNGLNLAPHGIAERVRRALTLAEGVDVSPLRIRALDFPQAVFWFEATFASDQKEQEILTVAIDLHYARQVRHLDQLLDYDRLAEAPAIPLVEARRESVAAVYPVARQRVVRTLAALANVRRRELTERVERQIERMRRYYTDLRRELDQGAGRARASDEDGAKRAARREALAREERLRATELRTKSTLRVQLRLVNLLVVQQPKLLVHSLVTSPRGMDTPLELVWDPLLEILEAARCPECGRPSLAWDFDRRKRLVCPSCPAPSLPR